MQRVAAAADFGNGISGLDLMNDCCSSTPTSPSTSTGCRSANGCASTRRAATSPNGIGIAVSDLYDEPGPIGRSIQSLLLDTPLTLDARRRHRGPRRPRQVDARARAHRHRPRPVRGGEAARPHHRPRLRLDDAAVGHGVAFVDVPGHVRFIKNMLAGVGAVDACLFVVAATEGWKPQSEEHLRILELLGVDHGRDRADQGRPRRRRLRRAGPPRGGRPLSRARSSTAPRSSRSTRRPGSGSASCGSRSTGCSTDTPAAVDRGRPRLWIDRTFAAKGAGHGGHRHVDRRSAGRVATSSRVVRGSRAARCGSAGCRHSARRATRSAPATASRVNLVGVAARRVRRGRRRSCGPTQWHRTPTVDASLRVLGVARPRRRRGAARTSPTSGQRRARRAAAHARAGERIAPGEAGLVRLHLPVALPLLPGDRYVLRESGRVRDGRRAARCSTSTPRAPASRARPDRSVDRVVAERGWVDGRTSSNG